MTVKILVADDSPTIQKVVRITLASTGHQLTEALDEVALFAKLKSEHFDLVLLDYNLSEDKSGYQLVSEVATFTQAKILALMGAFDSVDENELLDSGASDKIVKPFDSAQFLNKCSQLLDGKAEQKQVEEEIVFKNDNVGTELDLEELPDVIEHTPSVDDQWQMNEPEKNNFHSIEDELTDSSSDLLQNEISNWGLEVPPMIGGTDLQEMPELPPVIHQEIEFSKSTDEVVSISPKDTDLEYPDIMSNADFIEFNDSPSNTSEEIAFTSNAEEGLSLEQEINEEQSPDDFWKVDTSGENDLDAQEISVTPINLDTFQDLPSPHTFNLNIPEIDYEKIIAELKESMMPKLEEIIRNECRSAIQKIAWDVIPDLAENLIKKELKEIAASVKNN